MSFFWNDGGKSPPPRAPTKVDKGPNRHIPLNVILRDQMNRSSTERKNSETYAIKQLQASRMSDNATTLNLLSSGKKKAPTPSAKRNLIDMRNTFFRLLVEGHKLLQRKQQHEATIADAVRKCDEIKGEIELLNRNIADHGTEHFNIISNLRDNLAQASSMPKEDFVSAVLNSLSTSNGEMLGFEGLFDAICAHHKLHRSLCTKLRAELECKKKALADYEVEMSQASHMLREVMSQLAEKSNDLNELMSMYQAQVPEANMREIGKKGLEGKGMGETDIPIVLDFFIVDCNVEDEGKDKALEVAIFENEEAKLVEKLRQIVKDGPYPKALREALKIQSLEEMPTPYLWSTGADIYNILWRVSRCKDALKSKPEFRAKWDDYDKWDPWKQVVVDRKRPNISTQNSESGRSWMRLVFLLDFDEKTGLKMVLAKAEGESLRKWDDLLGLTREVESDVETLSDRDIDSLLKDNSNDTPERKLFASMEFSPTSAAKDAASLMSVTSGSKRSAASSRVSGNKRMRREDERNEPKNLFARFEDEKEMVDFIVTQTGVDEKIAEYALAENKGDVGGAIDLIGRKDG